MANRIVGRRKEIECLEEAYASNESEFIVVYGRRRIGKTYVVQNVFEDRFSFVHAGLYKMGKTSQLESFANTLRSSGYKECPKLKNWIDAFYHLEMFLKSRGEEKKVVFLDEIAWMDTQKSDFLPALEGFWNGWASRRSDILLVICASATTWVIRKVLKNKGGLHNRVTSTIHLQQFTLAECEEYAQYRGLGLTKSQILELYMVFGGVAAYWKLLGKKLSVAQNINNLLFAHGAQLKGEYDELYSSLFSNPEPYKGLVEALYEKTMGLTRSEIAKACDVEADGTLSDRLEELEQCGIIRSYHAYGKRKKDTFYQLVDFFTVFYYWHMRDNGSRDDEYWLHFINTPRYYNWCGLAFERVVTAHEKALKKALGIDAVATDVSAWKSEDSLLDGDEAGVQIDLVMDRKDGVINLIEMKWSEDGEYSISRDYDAILARKRSVFRTQTKTRKAIHTTLVTTCGVKRNQYAGNIQSEVVLDDLFAQR